MLIDGPGQVYFADRDNCIFKVDCLTFMDRKNPGEHLRDTLVDGEMVVDEHEGVKTPRYGSLVFYYLTTLTYALTSLLEYPRAMSMYYLVFSVTSQPASVILRTMSYIQEDHS